MNRFNKCIDKLWEGPVTYIALFVALMTVSILITGTGFHSAVVWVALASASVFCLAICSCVKCRKRASRWRRTSDRSDTISTVSDVNYFMHNMFPGGGGVGTAPNWRRRDSLPDYASATAFDPPPSPPPPPPPPYTSLVHNDVAPPSYDAVVAGLQILRVDVDVGVGVAVEPAASVSVATPSIDATVDKPGAAPCDGILMQEAVNVRLPPEVGVAVC